MSRDIQVPEDLFDYTGGGLTTPVDLVGASVGGVVKKNRAAYYLKIVAGSGTITVKMSGSVGTGRVLTVAAGEELFGKFTEISAVSGVTNVRAGWN